MKSTFSRKCKYINTELQKLKLKKYSIESSFQLDLISRRNFSKKLILASLLIIKLNHENWNYNDNKNNYCSV